MIPIHDANPTSRRAVVTVVLIVLNVAVFLLVQRPIDADQPGAAVPGTGGARLPADLSFELEWAAVPCELTQGEPLSAQEVVDTFNDRAPDDQACSRGGDESRQVFPDKHLWAAVVVSMFLHGGWLHLGGNMLFLWVFGNNVEDRLGRLPYLGFYLAGGIVATAGHVLANAHSTVPVVGASGAIAAVMGAYLVWYPNVRIRSVIFLIVVFFTEIRAKWLLAAWFVLQFFTGNQSGVAWVAHVAGFAFGVLAALAFGREPRRPQRSLA